MFATYVPPRREGDMACRGASCTLRLPEPAAGPAAGGPMTHRHRTLGSSSIFVVFSRFFSTSGWGQPNGSPHPASAVPGNRWQKKVTSFLPRSMVSSRCHLDSLLPGGRAHVICDSRRPWRYHIAKY